MQNTQLHTLLEKMVQEYARRKGFELPHDFDYELVATKDPSRRGDFASNVAFKLAPFTKQKPALVADELVLLLEADIKKRPQGNKAMIDRVEVAGGGFVNFFVTKAFLGQILKEIHRKGCRYGESDYGAGYNVIVEFVSANPTGPLTVAHGRQAAVGDSLVRILKATGHRVTAEYYLNDAGRQMKLLGESLWARYRTLLGQETPVPEEGYHGDYLIAIAEKLKQKESAGLLQRPEEEAVAICRDFATAEMMRGIKEDLTRMGVHFDHYFRESQLYQKNAVEHALHYLREQGYLYEKDGALWFRATTFGDDKDRVVKKSSGDYTYLAPDIAYHRHKFERGHNWIINLWGPDHHGYVARLKAACQALGHSAAEIDIRIVQLVSLYRAGEPVRMSTRAGEFVTLRELCQEVGVDAARFFFIMRRLESHLDFDLELAKEKSQENPVYYLQYAHARIASLLKFANRQISDNVDFELLATSEEMALVKHLAEYPSILVHASRTLEPYCVADYLRELATYFHKFYQRHRVVTEDRALTAARLLLVDCTRLVLKNGLQLLGISQPESM